jgi:hypothetical protein
MIWLAIGLNIVAIGLYFVNLISRSKLIKVLEELKAQLNRLEETYK